MLNVNKRAMFQKMIIGAMILAMFGFAFVRWFRFEQTSKLATKITYDSDLRDKIPENNPVILTPKTETSDFAYISAQVNQANNLFISGQNEKSLQVLENAVNRAFPKAEDKSNPNSKTFKNISDQIFTIQQNIKSGEKADASREIQDLLKALSTENQPAN